MNSSDNIFPPLALSPEVSSLLAKDCVVAIGVSGGKDGAAAALATAEYLDQIGHKGPRILVHSDLGMVEWRDSLPSCERLAAHLGWELLVVRRRAGGMLERWSSRWEANLQRYIELSCVKLILPWSTPAMRFCTSELKEDVIAGALKKRFPGRDILNVTGIRREESPSRAKKKVAAPAKKLTRKGFMGVTWHPIIDWKIGDVFARIKAANLALHEAYSIYHASRVSCIFCIMSAWADLLAGASCSDNHDLYIAMVRLEVASTFAFQGDRWLGDVAPHLLPSDLRVALAEAKVKAARRVAIEAAIPHHLLYVDGWPTVMPTMAEAELLANVRREIGALMGITLACTTADTILARYAHLMQLKEAKAAAKRSAARAPKLEAAA
jgi:3'-phosphoadenosine 5'-phosphosulfate sulfotransferase (PAPS reductase)/FAD synthetase